VTETESENAIETLSCSFNESNYNEIKSCSPICTTFFQFT